eukprot:gnl/Chilomastix_cuspidata/3049.p1 GENE.gnl/Chilomastix_cuspidata/3049~~gnl/Chilomastix_cuspidata/3049.p1  ORF type:complete len:210 (+),score=68.85 gnl/Chilomastix_cuspidata/3049:154-783(+)
MKKGKSRRVIIPRPLVISVVSLFLILLAFTIFDTVAIVRCGGDCDNYMSFRAMEASVSASDLCLGTHYGFYTPLLTKMIIGYCRLALHLLQLFLAGLPVARVAGVLAALSYPASLGIFVWFLVQFYRHYRCYEFLSFSAEAHNTFVCGTPTLDFRSCRKISYSRELSLIYYSGEINIFLFYVICALVALAVLAVLGCRARAACYRRTPQ